MGAFDGELSRLGYRFYDKTEQKQEETEHQQRRKEFLSSLHVAAVECPGSCGSACPNHHCTLHNGEPFKRPRSKLIFGRLGSDPLPSWMKMVKRL